jgi:amidase
VKDAAILLTAMAGLDNSDAITNESDGKGAKDYTAFLDANAITGKKIGVEKRFFEGHEAVVALYREAIALLKAKGATIVEVELRKLINELGNAEYTVLQYEFKDGVNKYLATANAPVKTLADVISFNKKNEATVMPFFKQEILESCEEKGNLENKEYTDAVAKSTSARNIINNMLQQNGLDAICGISTGMAGCIDMINGDYDTGFYFCPPSAMAGYPHITVPMGHIYDLPVGLSFIGKAYSEPVLIGLAYAYEQATKKRKQPAFKQVLG